MTDTTPLTTLLYLPLLGAVALLAIPKERNRAHWAIAIGASLLALVPCVAIIRDFRAHLADLQFNETSTALDSIGLGATLGVDGISLWLVALTVVLVPVVLIVSVSRVSYRVRAFAALVMLAEGAAIGAFCTRDLLTLFIFWLIVLAAIYLLIRGWSGDEGRSIASRFALYTGTSSALLLIGILALYDQANSFQFEAIASTKISPEDASWLAIAFSLGFLLQMAAFPLHGWYSGSVAQASTAPSILISGILVNMGLYGVLRFAIPLFPEALGEYSPLLLVLAVLGLAYGALIASGQSLLRKVIAFASMANLSVVLLGAVSFNEQSLQGSMILLVCHGLAMSAVLILANKLPLQDVPTAEVAPKHPTTPGFKTLFGLAVLSLIGLPLTGGFVGHFLVISASFGEGLPIYAGLGISDWPTLVVIGSGVACLSFVLATVYGLKLLRSLGSETDSDLLEKSPVSVSRVELGIVTPLIAALVIIGVSPNFMLKRTESSVNRLVELHRPTVQIARDAKRTAIRLEKRKQATRTGPGRRPGVRGPGSGKLQGKKVQLKGVR